MAGILVALVALIVVLLTQRGDGGNAPAPSADRTATAVADGQVARRSDLASPPKPPNPLDDPDRIREALQKGRTYSSVLKVGLDARAEDKAWAVKKVVSLAYAAELAVDRTIEENDGRRVVELRHFARSRNVKLLCDVESVTIELGVRGTLLLGALDAILPGTAAAATAAKPIFEVLLGYGADAAARAGAATAVAHVDSLQGKRVRIAYVDGVGVESVAPIGCALSAEERDFVFATAVLSDCYLWDLRKAPGERWSVDGSQLGGLLDPSLRGAGSGEVRLVRDPDGSEGGRPYAALRIEGGTVTIVASDDSARRVGSFTPEGTLRFDLAEKFATQASLTGRFAVDEVSTDHILFETSFRTRPTLKVEYSCTVR
ncbi:MAG TPA: hypothetical protein VG406_11535 [Isosphaeraceae bacterium]|nr:hypothetical protein [Isosphaeraceae bacterium]